MADTELGDVVASAVEPQTAVSMLPSASGIHGDRLPPAASRGIRVSFSDLPEQVEVSVADDETFDSEYSRSVESPGDEGEGSEKGTSGPDVAENPERWEGLLHFLNEPMCYLEPGAPIAAQPSTSILWRLARKLRGVWRRLKVAFLKRGRMTRRLPPHACCARNRNFVGEIVLSPIVQGMVLLVIMLDVTVSLYKIIDGFANGHEDDVSETVYVTIDFVVLSLLGFEVACRIFFLGKRYTHSWLNLIEFCLVPLAFFELLTRSDSGGSIPLPVLRTLRPILRATNLVLKAARGLSRVTQFQKQMQLQVSGSKRRWTMDGFDLDLCYVDGDGDLPTEAGMQLIAMGRPAVGCDAFYNNPLPQVAQFFHTRHRNNFVIVNASERSDYPVEDLLGRVINFPIQEQGVPKLQDLWDLCGSLRGFLSDDQHVVAVHSRIGGGRIGLVINGYLLYNNTFKQASDAMNNFETRLTDPSSQGRVPGVDCPSQMRFTEYFSVCARELHCVPDPPRKARLRSIKLVGVEREDACMLSVRCFAHGARTTARSAFPWLTREMSRSGSTISNRSSSGSFGGQSGGGGGKDSGEEAVMLMMHEEELLQQVQYEQEATRFDTIASGCRPQMGTPLLDTAGRDPKVLSSMGGGSMLSEVVVWQIDSLELAGEICFEIHKSMDEGSIASEEGPTQLLLATWLHTSFLEMSQGSGTAALNRMNNKSVCVTLGRFDLDKGARAPSLRSYGSSFEVQLLFDVDELMQYRWRMSDSLDNIAKVTGRQADVYGMEEQVLCLQPPTGDNVSDTYDAGWLTWCVEKLWPNIDEAIKKLMHDEVEPEIRKAVPAAMGQVKISECSLGTKIPVIGSIKASQRAGVRNGLQLDIFIDYNGDASFMVCAGRTSVGVTEIKLHGTLSLLLDPIVHQMPVVGGLHIFFLNPPKVQLQFVGHVDFANVPWLKRIIQNQVNKSIAEKIVLPNVFTINWMDERIQSFDNVVWFSSMLPTGLLRVGIPEMEAMTPTVANCGTQTQQCKPISGSRYVLLKLGAQTRREYMYTDVTHEVCQESDLLVYDVKQNFSVEIWDGAPLGDGKLLGTSEPIPLQQLLGGSPWKQLLSPDGDEINTSIRLRTRLFNLHADRRKLEQASRAVKAAHYAKANSSSSSQMASRALSASRSATVTHTTVTRTTSSDTTALAPAVAGGGSVPPPFHASPSRSMDDPRTAHTSCSSAAPDSWTRPTARRDAIGVLVCHVPKGRLPETNAVMEYALRVRLGNDQNEHPFTMLDTAWRTDYRTFTDTTENTIKALAQEGFTAERIAKMMSMEEPLVAKIVAHDLGFNVEIPQHLCVLLTSIELPDDLESEACCVRLEILHQGRVEASGNVSLGTVLKASGMKIRSLVECQVVYGLSGARYDLDVELRLFACVPHKGGLG